MKTVWLLIFCICFLLSNGIFSQSITAKDVLRQPDSLIWSKYEKKNEKELKKFLDFIYKDTTFHFWGSKINYTWQEEPFHPDTFALYHKQFIHFIDLDGDKDLDVLYDGREFPGLESGDVFAFANTGNNFELLFRRNGTTKRIHKQKDKSYVIETVTYPCCSEYRFSWNEFGFQKEEGKTKAKVISSTGFLWIYDEKNQIKILNEKKRFASTTGETCLITGMFVPDSPPNFNERKPKEDFYSDYVAILPENTNVQVLFEAETNKEKWLFVVAEFEDVKVSLFDDKEQYIFEDVNFIGGWIKGDTELQK